MLNGEINELTTAELLSQVASYFQVIENSISVGDTNRKYVHSKNSSRAPSGKITSGSFTTVVISPIGENMSDLYNSCITADMHVTLSLANDVPETKFDGARSPAIWVGFKDSMNAINTYQILANGQQIYAQNNAIEESYITDCGCTEACKSVDIFSKVKHSDVWDRCDTVRSGAIIELSNKKAGQAISVKIPIKIPLRRFLPLSGIRYLPAFAGNIELRIRFSPEALVVAPLPMEDMFLRPNLIHHVVNSTPVTNKFTPLNETFRTLGSCLQDKTTKDIVFSPLDQRVSVQSSYVDEVFSVLQCFSLDPNVYTDLVQHYTERPLAFPTKEIVWMNMDGSLSPTGRSTFNANATPRFVNGIFVLWQQNNNYKTCYDNPMFKGVQLKMGAYGVVPSDLEPTNGPIMFDLANNAMNTNNDMAGFNSDVMRSLTTDFIPITGYKSYDTTNYFMAFPTETDFTFMQGQTSNSPITYQLTIDMPQDHLSHAQKFTNVPMIGFLRHTVFAIQIEAQGPPRCVIDQYDLAAAE